MTRLFRACLLATPLKRRAFHEGSNGFVTSTAAPSATCWCDPVAGWELLPLKNHRLGKAHALPEEFAALELSPARE